MEPGKNNISISELMLNLNDVKFDSLVCQTEIQTVEDKEKYATIVNPFVLTESDVCELLSGIDLHNIYYTPSVGQSAIYFNKETLAACPCNIEMTMLPNIDIADFNRAMRKTVRDAEAAVKERDFRQSIFSLPDTLSMEYFNLLLDKYPGGGEDIPRLFALFFSRYLMVSFGFARVRPDVFQKIVEARTSEDEAEVREALADYPDTIRVYRGGSTTISRPIEIATSWTTSISAALFFAGRLGIDSGYIAIGSVPKEKVVYCQLETLEQEVIVQPGDVQVESVLHLLSVEDVKPYLGGTVQMYHDYRDRLEDVEFEMDSHDHGRLHCARVLLHALIIAEMKGLPASDKRILAEAAIYHDSQRNNDGEDTEHGRYSADYYRLCAEKIDPLVSFIIEYHCRPDEDGYRAIQNKRALSRNRTRSRLLFDIFKDADALDRVRFGWQELDINQLRTEEAKSLPLFAHISVSMIKL